MSAKRTGEAWRASVIRPESILFDLVNHELSVKDSNLRRLMLGKWYGEHRSKNEDCLRDTSNPDAASNRSADHDRAAIGACFPVQKVSPRPSSAIEHRDRKKARVYMLVILVTLAALLLLCRLY
jgi:hypothetical protein